MITYTITKYNPIYRDENRGYKRTEWTSISDIGKKFNDVELKIEEYLNVENKYITAINYFLDIIKDDYLQVDELEKHKLRKVNKVKYDEGLIIMFNKVTNNLLVSKNEILQISKLALREDVWCKLSHPQGFLKIEFGYDYYLYIQCFTPVQHIVDKVRAEVGLFVEQ